MGLLSKYLAIHSVTTGSLSQKWDSQKTHGTIPAEEYMLNTHPSSVF